MRFLIFSVLTVLLTGLLAACGETTQPVAAGQVLPNTVAPPVAAETLPPKTTIDPNLPIPTTTPYPTRQPVAGIPMFGTTIYVFDKVTNQTAQENFLAAYGQGQPGQWEAVLHTVEGDPISYFFLYQGNGPQIKVSIDNTRDAFAAPEDRRNRDFMCQGISKTPKTIKIKGCSDGKEPGDWEIPLP